MNDKSIFFLPELQNDSKNNSKVTEIYNFASISSKVIQKINEESWATGTPH